MNTQTDQGVAGSQDRIGQAVLAQYAGNDDICVLNAVKSWTKERIEAREEEPLGELVQKIESPAMEKLAIEWHTVDIDTRIAVERAHQLTAKLSEAKSRFVSGLAIHEGIYASSDDLQISVPRMEIRHLDEAALKRNMPRKIVALCKAMASGEVAIADVRNGKLPSQFREVRMTGKFVPDMACYLDEGGEDAKEQVVRTCEDRTYARRMFEDDLSAPQLRFLAMQVLATQSREAVLDKPRQVGFNVQ